MEERIVAVGSCLGSGFGSSFVLGGISFFISWLSSGPLRDCTPKFARILVKIPAVKVVSAFLIMPNHPAVSMLADHTSTVICTIVGMQCLFISFRGLAGWLLVAIDTKT